MTPWANISFTRNLYLAVSKLVTYFVNQRLKYHNVFVSIRMLSSDLSNFSCLTSKKLRELISLDCLWQASSSDTISVNESNILCQIHRRKSCAEICFIRLTFSSSTYLLLSRRANYRRTGIFPRAQHAVTCRNITKLVCSSRTLFYYMPVLFSTVLSLAAKFK